jgi:hypothetical protein
MLRNGWHVQATHVGPSGSRAAHIEEGELMKRILGVALIALAVVSLYAATAPAGQQAVTPKQFKALTNRVTKLEKDDQVLIGFASILATCLDKGAVATNKNPQYHIPATGESTDFYVFTTTNVDCVNVINSPRLAELLKLARR